MFTKNKNKVYAFIATILTSLLISGLLIYPSVGKMSAKSSKPLPSSSISNSSESDSMLNTSDGTSIQTIALKNNSNSRKTNSSTSSTTSSSTTSSSTSSSSSSSTSSTSSSTSSTTSSASTTTTNVLNGKSIVGYYTSWSRYSGYYPSNIDASKITHLNYAFANIDSSLHVVMGDTAVDPQNFADLRTLKQNNPNLKTLISIGGWDYSKYFSTAASSSANREIFAQSCLDFILQNGFNGVDIDWEYPVSGGKAGNINSAADKQNFTYLLQAIRAKLNAQTQQDGKTYYLSITGVPSAWYLTKIEAKNVSLSVDYIFIMGYDIHGPWDSVTGFNAPLYAPAGQASVSDGINAYLGAGVAASKLVLGMPFYGYQFTVSNSTNNGLSVSFTSCKSISYNNLVSSFLNNSAYTVFYDQLAQVPYIFGNNTFITFENAQSIAAKTQFAKSLGLGGIGAWELSQDRSATLLTSAYNTLID